VSCRENCEISRVMFSFFFLFFVFLSSALVNAEHQTPSRRQILTSKVVWAQERGHPKWDACDSCVGEEYPAARQRPAHTTTKKQHLRIEREPTPKGSIVRAVAYFRQNIAYSSSHPFSPSSAFVPSTPCVSHSPSTPSTPSQNIIT
jgi:hypothetical protein